MSKISDKEYNRRVKLFQDSIKKYIDYFGLIDYELFFDEQHNIENQASVYWRSNSGDQNVTVTHTVEWLKNSETKDNEIIKCAFHEVMEILLSHLSDFGTDRERNITEREIITEVHRIIRVMENKVFPLIKLSALNKEK